MPPKAARPPKKGSKAAATKSGKVADAVVDDKAGVPAEESAADRLRKDGIVTTYAHSSKKMHRNVRDISVSNLTVTFHGSPLVEDTELTLNYGNRYGYIGRNGCGKTTFMKVIGARCFPIPDGIDIFHLKEEIEATEMTAKEAVMSVDNERATLEREAEEINDFLVEDDGGEDSEEAMDRLTQVYERLEELDAATAETRASKILCGLGFTPEKQQKKTKEFSGGWRMRIALARALFIQPTLLLLDEPTNHLDMEAVVWLEDYLSKWNKILFMVSHSQDFMNSVCTHMVNHTRKGLVYYTGNYDSFVNTREEKEGEQEKRFRLEQDQIKHMKDYVAKFGQGNAKMARQAQSKEKILDKMLKSGLTDKVEHEKALDFKFPDCGKISPPVLQCNDIAFGYPGCEILYAGVDFGIDLDSRVALVGPNGAGKSTLLKIMTGELLPLTGAVRPHAHLRISKFTQHFIDALDLSMTPLDYFLAVWPDLTREDGRKFLGRFGISGHVQTQIMDHLSDGQKSRVVLAKMAKETPHLLLLDEPTNHLDMESIDSLAKAINQFSGGMVLVSHDMRLISQVAKEIWMCDNRTVSKFQGDISDFKMQLRRQMQLADSDAPSKNLASAKSSAAPLGYAPSAPTPAPSSASAFPPMPLSAKQQKESEDDMILKARLELAEMAIARQRARKAQESGSGSAPVAPASADVTAAAAVPALKDAKEIEEAEEAAKLEEKVIAKAKRKVEKEAIAAEEKREEEGREKRRLEKIRDNEEAKKMKEEQAKQYEEFLIVKAARDAKKKAQEDLEAQILADALQKRREEKEARKKIRMEARLAEAAVAKAEAEARVMADPWTQEQQVAFETALLTYTNNLEKTDRWTKIAAEVTNKTRNQCMARYRFLKDFVTAKLKFEATPLEV